VNVPALGLLDTTAVTLADQLDPDQLPTEAVITAVTLLSCPWAHSPPTIPRERAIRQLRLQDVEANFAPLPFDAEAARAYGRVADVLRRSGRKPSARAFDALIAATAMANSLPLLTCNPHDFSGIDGLTLVPVDHPDAR